MYIKRATKTNMKKLKGFRTGGWKTNRYTMDALLKRLDHKLDNGADNVDRANRINRLLGFEAVRWNRYKQFWFTSRLYTELEKEEK